MTKVQEAGMPTAEICQQGKVRRLPVAEPKGETSNFQIKTRDRASAGQAAPSEVLRTVRQKMAVLSDGCEQVSTRTVTLPLLPRQVGATQQERRFCSA